MLNRYGHLFLFFLLGFWLCACGPGKQADRIEDKMSEMEQLMYNNALKKLESICAQAREAANGDEGAMAGLRYEISNLKYDFNGSGMGKAAREKCLALKERIDALKKHPENVFQGAASTSASGSASTSGSTSASDSQGCRGTLIFRRNMILAEVKRFPYYLNAGDKLSLNLDGTGSMKASFYDIQRRKCMKQWRVSGSISDSVAIADKGIYLLELVPVDQEVAVDLSLSYTGTDRSYRKRVLEKLVECKKGDFLAFQTDSIVVSNVFKEPKKVGLRGNLKAMFSGKSRVVVPVTVPASCDALLYSLRISTNEETVSSDGKFTEKLSNASSRVKLFGVTVYEKQSIASQLISSLLGSARPPREEDAFCNMYVLTNAKQAKRFQDETASSGNYEYDVEQSQLGTQSCNGQLFPRKNKVIYLGFENERMRYDNFIWLEMSALNYTKKYVRPIYLAR